MDIQYCDVCGSLVNGVDLGKPGAEEVGLLCEVCLRTRRVLPDVGPACDASKDGNPVTRFRCPHCERKLRVKPVRSRVEIDCPRCKGSLVLHPGGEVEAGAPTSSTPVFRESSAERPLPSHLDDLPADATPPGDGSGPVSPVPSSESGRSPVTPAGHAGVSGSGRHPTFGAHLGK